MSKNNYSKWATEIELDEVYEELEGEDNLLDSAYEAVNKFCRQYNQRSSHGKYNKKQCWQ